METKEFVFQIGLTFNLNIRSSHEFLDQTPHLTPSPYFIIKYIFRINMVSPTYIRMQLFLSSLLMKKKTFFLDAGSGYLIQFVTPIYSLFDLSASFIACYC